MITSLYVPDELLRKISSFGVSYEMLRSRNSRLIAAAKELGRARGAKGVTIGTAHNNETAQAAYRAMGLKEITDAGPRFWIPVD